MLRFGKILFYEKNVTKIYGNHDGFKKIKDNNDLRAVAFLKNTWLCERKGLISLKKAFKLFQTISERFAEKSALFDLQEAPEG